jgi:hypothetical protein
MAYLYESIQPGLFNFTVPGKDRTVKLFLGSRILLDQKLSGGYLRVLKFIKEVPDKPVEEVVVPKEINSQAKVADKITKVEEVLDNAKEDVAVAVDDTIKAADEIVEENQQTQTTPITKTTAKKPTIKKGLK